METATLQPVAVETAVALPSDIFQQAEDLAKTLGLTRNELYAEALEQLIKRKRDVENHRQWKKFYDEADSSLNANESSGRRPRRKKMTPAEEEEFIRQLNEVYDRVDTSLDPFVMQLQLTALDPEERLKKYHDAEITRRLNELYENEDSSPDPVMTQLQFETLEPEEW